MLAVQPPHGGIRYDPGLNPLIGHLNELKDPDGWVFLKHGDQSARDDSLTVPRFEDVASSGRQSLA